MRGAKPGATAGYLPKVIVATLGVAVLPGVAAGALQGAGMIEWWLSIGMAVALSMAAAAAGSAWWTRRPAARDIVFSDLMLWGWARRLRTERRVASTRVLLRDAGHLGPARQAAVLERLSAALEARDPHVHGHSQRVARHAHMIAERLGLPPGETARIRTAAAVHDVGKIETPREILNKPGKLTDAEFATIKRHPVDGAAMVAAVGDDELTAIVRHHHERLDGGGYPDGLRGDEIPLGARVIAVADTFDALTSSRPYRSARSHKQALDILRAEAGAQVDPDAVAAFLSYYSGRRRLPWVAALAAAPSRLAVWALSGAQGGGLAPLGTGAAALGAALLAGGALSGAPAPPGDEPAATVASLAPVQVAEPPSPRERSSSEPAGRPRAVAHRGLGPPAVRRDRPAPGPDRISAGNPPSAPPGGGGSSSVGVPDSPPSTGSAATSGAGVPSVADVVEVPEPEAVPALPALPKVPVQIQVQVPLPQPSLPKLP